jgi:hypothetical protein
MKLKVESESWYIKPEMLGHTLSKQTVGEAKQLIQKYTTPRQRQLLAYVLNLDATDWHYWFNWVSKKYMRQIQYILRRIDKVSPLTLLNWKIHNSGALKDKLDWALEQLCYQSKEQNAYQAYYIQSFTFLGMPKSDAIQRFHDYHAKLASKNPLIWS